MPPTPSPVRAGDAARDPRHRLVLIGASNLTSGMRVAIHEARAMRGAPLEVLAAAGFGRSYGKTSFVLGRSLPGIVACGLWRRLEDAPALPTWALLTDIGNDILYRVPVETILVWVEECVERLSRRGARITVTQLPLQSLRRLQRWRYLAARTLLFPLSRLPHGEALARVEALQQGLRRLSERRGIELLEPAAHWYGADPIHIRRRFRSEAWRRFLAVETTGVAVAPARDLCRGGLAPLSSKVFGRERRCEQPCVRLGDGSTVSLF